MCVRAGQQHIWWPCDTTHNQMKENCLVSPAAWFKFHCNQIGGRDKCQLVPLAGADLGGRALHLITCMLWFSSASKNAGTPNRKKLLVVKSSCCFSSSKFHTPPPYLKMGCFFPSFQVNATVAALGNKNLCPCRIATSEHSPSGTRMECQA